MEKEIKYHSVAVVEREEHLKANAEFSEKTTIKRPYLENEIDDFSRSVVGFLNQIVGLEEKLDEVSSPIKEEMKKLKLQAKELQDKVRNGYEVQEIDVFGFKNYDDNTVEYYNAEGVFVYSRRLMPGERQVQIFPLDKTGTNN